MNAQVYTYSSYKSANTFKALIGVSPQELVTYVSNLWGGRATDRAITENCGILDLIEPGDDVMADLDLGLKIFWGRRKRLSTFPRFGKKAAASYQQGKLRRLEE